jgi:hypothetical protein
LKLEKSGGSFGGLGDIFGAETLILGVEREFIFDFCVIFVRLLDNY